MADGTSTYTPPCVRSLHIKAIRKADREVDFVASTDAVDSYGEIVEQVWLLDRYNANPVVLFAHKSRELPIGHSVKHGVESGKLVSTIRFATAEANPLAEQVWQSILQGTLRAVSVGFNPKTIRYEKHNDKDIVVLSDNELWEISVTPIPANPEALAKALERAAATNTPPKAPTSKDKNMDIEKATAEIATLKAEKNLGDKQLADAQKSIESLTKLSETAASERDKAVKERDAAIAERDALTKAKTALEVKSLVGVKITPAEEADFVELAATNPKLFKSIVDKRADMCATQPTTVLAGGAEPRKVLEAGNDALTNDMAALLAG